MAQPFDTPRAYEDDYYPWNLHRVPKKVRIGKEEVPHPALHSAVFVVHGIGDQHWCQTGATLRLGLEDALVVIRKWQEDEHLPADECNAGRVPPPFLYEGYWADYGDLEKTFPEDWKRFETRERHFFKYIWASRVYSTMRTIFWFLWQQLRLLDPRRICTLKFTWFIYLPLLFFTPVILLYALIKAPRIVSGVLADVRMYANPRGMAEQAIVQRIDRRVGAAFLRLIGLDWDFRPLADEQLVHCSGEPFIFDRVIWVSHSLGTVVSYNVLSDLFARAAYIGKKGDDKQKAGKERFYTALRRFITLGSPLDKFAYLYPNALRPWHSKARKALLQGGESPGGEGEQSDNPAETEWWINFYNVFDPVSGALNHPLICGHEPPANVLSILPLKSSSLKSFVPGVAHVAYWSVKNVTRFILSRVYGIQYLHDLKPKRQTRFNSTCFAIIGYAVWVALLYGTLYVTWTHRNWLIHLVWDAAKGLLKKAAGT